MRSVINSELEQILKTHPSIGIILSGYAYYLAEYHPIIQFMFFVVGGLISMLILINKMADTYWRFAKWRAKRRKK